MGSKLFKEALEQVPKHTSVFVEKNYDIVDRIHFLLEKKEMSQKELAEKLGKRESEVSKWLSNGHNLTLKSIAKLEAVLEEEIITVPTKLTGTVSSSAIADAEEEIHFDYQEEINLLTREFHASFKSHQQFKIRQKNVDSTPNEEFAAC